VKTDGYINTDTSAQGTKTLKTLTDSSIDVTEDSYTVSGGTYVPNDVTFTASLPEVETVDVATPTITVNTSGQITAKVNQSAGNTSGGTKTTTAYLSDEYDSDFVSSNIKSGVTIFGVQGTYIGTTSTSDATASASDVLSGKVFYGKSGRSTGSMTNHGQHIDTMTMNGKVKIPKGYHDGTGYIDVAIPDAEIGDAVIVSSSGKYQISLLIDSAGYINEGKYLMHEIPLYQSSYSIMPSAATTHVETAGRYVNKNIQITGDVNLAPENIKKGVSIFGVEGTYSGEISHMRIATRTLSSYSSSITFSVPLDGSLPGMFILYQLPLWVYTSQDNRLVVHRIAINPSSTDADTGCFIMGSSKISGSMQEYAINGIGMLSSSNPISMSISNDQSSLVVTFSGTGTVGYSNELGPRTDIVDYEFYGDYTLICF
jgi:hypothetical protein